MTAARRPLPGTCWRPWSIDTLATVVDRTPVSVDLRYDHDPEHTVTLSRREYDSWGREVRRTEFERGKSERAIAALARLEAVFELEDAA